MGTLLLWLFLTFSWVPTNEAFLVAPAPAYSHGGRRCLNSQLNANKNNVNNKKDWTTSIFPVLPTDRSALSFSNTTSATSRIVMKQPILAPPDTGFVSQACCQFYAGSIGALTGFLIAGFKLSIEGIREYTYGNQVLEHHPLWVPLIPVAGGVAVAGLAFLGGSSFPPGVRGIVQQADQDVLGRNQRSRLQELTDSARKAAAAICTLGTGCSLGPEGPGVEIGIAASRLGTLFWPTAQLDHLDGNNYNNSNNNNPQLVTNARILHRNRLFLACGAAAGVSSGFNAPLAGVFFALEVIQTNLPPVDLTPIPTLTPSFRPLQDDDAFSLNQDDTTMASITTMYEYQQESLLTEAGSITAIFTSSVVSALVIRILLGNELALRILEYEIPTPLRELPLYFLLGATSGLLAVVFSQTAQLFKAGFDGEIGPDWLQQAMDATPQTIKPIVGGLVCGSVGYFFPNILFFGYETLNGLLLNNQLETGVAVTLLAAKIFATSVSAGSGLVGGTLAPSLLMGGMVGSAFHNVLIQTIDVSTLDFLTTQFGSAFEIASLPAYTMVGAASFLAAVFRAPLTASLLAFELTKNYNVLVPLLASAGVGTLFCDLVERRIDPRR